VDGEAAARLARAEAAFYAKVFAGCDDIGNHVRR
jgi:hypothetical protein